MTWDMGIVWFSVIVLLAVWAGSVAWVWRDANQRGQPGFIVAVLAACLVWPISLLIWAAARPGLAGEIARYRHWLWALVGVIIVLPIEINIGFAVAMPTLKAIYAANLHQIVCKANEHQIAKAYAEFMNDNSGKCPRSFEQLRKYGVTDQMLHCPSSADDFSTSYRLYDGTNSEDVIVREKASNHHDQKCVGTLGGGVFTEKVR